MNKANSQGDDALSVCVVVNKDGARLAPSETFLRAHMTRLPFRTQSVVGNPGSRRLDEGNGAWLQSPALPARAARWARDRSGLASAAAQDSKALAEFLRAQRFDAVVAEYGPTALTVMDACRSTNTPMVTHFHGWDAYVLAPKAEDRAAYQALFAQSEAIIAVSRHMRAHLIALGAPPERTVWNPCGAEVTLPPTDPSQAPPLFVTVGRAAPKKATVVVLLAFAQVLAKVPDARLELVGGHSDQVTGQLTRALGIQHAVTFLGSLSNADVLTLMRRARCYIHPSVTAPDGDMEGTPVSVLEGMAAGLPVVSTRHGGILDVLDGTSAGVLVDEFDVDATAAGMLQYALDPQLARTHGLEGRRLMETRWSMAHSLDALAQVVRLAATRDRQALATLAAGADQG